MKLEAIKIGLTTAAACALALASCDNSSGDGTGDAATTNDTEAGDDGGTTAGAAEDSGTAATSEPADSGSDSADDGPVGMGEDPPTYDCSMATETLVQKYFTIDTGEFDEIELLEGVKIIDGNIDINRTNYNNLDFLLCVTEITGTLTIFGNDFLVDVSALNNLEVLGGDFVFTNNNAITVFDGMDKIKQIYRSPNPECEEKPCGGNGQPPIEFLHSIVMNKNEKLERIDGWGELEFIFGNITIRDNTLLKSIDGFKGLIGIGLTLAIAHNPELCMSSVNAVGAGIQAPPPDAIPASWTTSANNPDC